MKINFLNKIKNNGIIIWIIQRITIIIFLFYNLFILEFFFTKKFIYENFKKLFLNNFFKIFTILSFSILFYHIYIGLRDVCIDYIKNDYSRIIIQFFIILYIIFYNIWLIKIILRI